MKKTNTRFLVEGAMIAALYAALTYVSGLLGLAYGPVQFRLSEVLTILPLFTPAAIPGLAIGCVLGNLGSPMGIIDIVCGSAATLLAALCTYALRKVRIKGWPVLSSLMPVLFNMVIVGMELEFLLVPGHAFTFTGFLVNALYVGIGEFAVVTIGGQLLAVTAEKTGVVRKLQHLR